MARGGAKVERWQIDRLIPYAKKARPHTDAQAVLGISEIPRSHRPSAA
jgi:hypothetical protein